MEKVHGTQAESVTSLVSEAEFAFAQAEYVRCLALCDRNTHDVFLAVLAAAAAFRRRDYVEALRRGEAVASACPAGDVKSRALGVIASACGAMGDHARAHTAIEQINSFRAELSRSGSLQVAYDTALVAWMRGDYVLVERILRQCDYSEEPLAKAQADFLRSWGFAKNQRYAEQAVLLCNAIRALHERQSEDVGTLARAVHALSVIVREVHVPVAVPVLSDLLPNFAWTSDLAYEHFQTLRNVGWHDALKANYIAGIRQLDLAKRLAVTPHWLLMSHLDHAQIARIAGERFTVQAQLQQAADLMDRISDDAEGDEALAFVVAAEVFADTDIPRSRVALKRFRSLRSRMPSSFALAEDPRTEAMYRYAAAVVAVGDGRMNHAKSHAGAALDIFDGIGFQWRAARCALVLYQCTADDGYLRIARERIRFYPRSFVAEEIAAVCGSKGSRAVSALTRRQRDVLDVLLEGLTVEEAAQRLNMSPNTLKTHKNHIYSHLRVRNRMELGRRVALITSESR